jgi:hypothetical protein
LSSSFKCSARQYARVQRLPCIDQTLAVAHE